jgi:hypothetical protein
VGRHSSEVVTTPLQRIFIDFLGPIDRSWRENIAILVVLDGFSKFFCMYPVRIILEVVKTYLVENKIAAFGVLQSIVSDNVAVFKSRTFCNFCFMGNSAYYLTLLSPGLLNRTV